ncbi:hybrid sensor histidine kinase/response regulator transcription factor [Agromyces larvae]|uniref:GAF domain-containing protein n=1 Tax=Agromyces larvae TaxID=2929802 RepID=A0ABY4C1C9_9MICO|nr:GAF domain-containing protein [Agromyces larvae]UOE45293.1 GAF domain-containing protein [Agromyces larvae]
MNPANPHTSLRGDPRFDALITMAADLAGRFDPQRLLERILRHTMALLDCDSGSICTVDEAAGTYRKEVDLGVGCLSGRTFPLDEGVTGEVVRARRPVVFDEYAHVRGGHIAARDRSELHGVIGVPILSNGAIIGTCVVFSRDPDRRFTEADVALVELFATHAAIAIANARLHALAADKERQAAVLAERERVMRDVHDTVGRGLATVLLHLDDAERAIGRADDPVGALGRARSAARTALTETQRSVLGFDPGLTDAAALAEAVRLELSWIESAAGVATRLIVIGDPVALPPETGRQLLRIVQEALTNVLEHAGARTVRVGLVYGGHTVSVLIEDDGRGFDVASVTAEPRRALGLQGLLARAQHLGGTLQIESSLGWGTRIRAEVPRWPAVDSERTRWRVLVAHEHELVRAGLVRVLSDQEPDIQVVGEVSGSRNVVEAYELLRPHVVVAPLDHPHVDGVQLTAYLRAVDPDAAVVLLVPSFSDERLRGAAQIGATGFVEEHTDAAGLVRAVVAAARGDTLLTPEVFSLLTAPDDPLLTPREREVRDLVARGLPDKQIAVLLRISVKTVEKHVGAILRKTGAANRTELAGLRREAP